jgi:hypothetical protein
VEKVIGPPVSPRREHFFHPGRKFRSRRGPQGACQAAQAKAATPGIASKGSISK